MKLLQALIRPRSAFEETPLDLFHLSMFGPFRRGRVGNDSVPTSEERLREFHIMLAIRREVEPRDGNSYFVFDRDGNRQ